MKEMVTRPYAAGDATAVAELVNLASEHAGGHADLTPPMVEDLVTHRIPDAESNTRLVFGPDGTLAAVGLVQAPPTGGTVVVLYGSVHPRLRGRGLGRELLGWQLDRAERSHLAMAPAEDWEVHTGSMLGDESAARLSRRFGMAPVRYWFEMTAPTAPAAQIPADAAAATAGVRLPDGVRLETYSPGHEPALHLAHMEAFAEHWRFQRRDLEQWAELTVRSERFLPELSPLALDGTEIAGYVLCYESSAPDRLYVGQVGVRERWRRRGMAAAMMVWVLDTAHRAGRTTASLGVDADSPTGAVGVYERVGFTVDSRAVTYSRSLDRQPGGDAAGAPVGAPPEP